jgi:protein-tyrosine phosphatase
MAMALLRARLARDASRQDWQVSSMGVWATDGQPASAHSTDAMAERGLDLRAHRARRVSRDMMAQADLVLVMTQSHAGSLQAAFPDHAHKVHMLAEMVGQAYDIRDPYGGSRQEYALVAEELERLIENGYERIVALVEGAPDG